MLADQIFVTGATGYAGRYVAAELVRRALPVTALIRQPVHLDGCHTILGDLAAAAGFLDEISGAAAILHLASARSYTRDAALAEIASTSCLLDAWRRGPFIYASSGTIQAGQRAPIRESMPVRISTPYGWSKLCNEFQLRAQAGGFQRGPAVILRPAVVFAANERSFDRQVLGQIYRHSQSDSRFIFASDEGLDSYGTSYIGGADFGRAVADALRIEVAGTYNVAGGFCTWRELIEMINRYAGSRASFAVRPGGHAGPGEYVLPQSRRQLGTRAFESQTGFAPQQPLDQLIAEFARAQRAATAVGAPTGTRGRSVP